MKRLCISILLVMVSCHNTYALSDTETSNRSYRVYGKFAMPLAINSYELWNIDGTPRISPDDLLAFEICSWRTTSVNPGSLGCVGYPGDSSDMYYIRLSGQDQSGGNPPSVDIYDNQLWLENLSGDVISSTAQAMDIRLQEDNWTYNSWKAAYDPISGWPATRRLVLFPIIQADDTSGYQQQVSAFGFAAFFISGYDQNTGISGHVIQMLSTDGFEQSPFTEAILVPEPASLPTMLCGLGGICGVILRKRS